MVTRVVFLIGPTAVGKTELAIELAEAFGGEIVGADSRQVYRDLDIGTAKPSHEERARLPHHLIDVANPDEPFALAHYLRLARLAIKEITAQGRVPFVVGGTGQYLWGLLKGHRPPSVAPDPHLREELEALAQAEGPVGLHTRLKEIDAARASRTDPRNPRRLIRALEVAMAGLRSETVAASFPGRTPLHVSPEAEEIQALVLGLTMPRELLYARADARIEAMLAAGWLDEIYSLLQRYGSARTLPAFAALGYRQLAAHLTSDCSLEEAVQRAKFETHRFIRQQYTWFRRPDFGTRWFDIEDQGSAKSELQEAIASFLRFGRRVPMVYSTTTSPS